MSRENKPWNYWFNPNNIQFELDWAYAKNEERRKAKQIPGSIYPDNRSQYWSGTKWLNLSDIPDIPQTSEDKKQKAEEKAVAENELVGPIAELIMAKLMLRQPSLVMKVKYRIKVSLLLMQQLKNNGY